MKGSAHLLGFVLVGAFASMAFSQGACAQPTAPKTFNEALLTVMSRPEFRHASFGVEIYSLDKQKPVFALNPNALFTPGSTTKLLTEGTALMLLGADYRFHTPVYRTGEIGPDGVLVGDLVLVASGDPNLSNRAQPDGTLAFADEDHSYGGVESRVVPGDPLAVIRSLAKQISGAGVRRVVGRVLVDVSLFPEGERELGTNVVISPIAVNDNVIDLTFKPGASIGAPLEMSVSPQVPSIRFVNRTKTTAGSKIEFGGAETVDNADGSETVTLSGSMGQASKPSIYGYPVSSPSRYAGEALTMALRDLGVRVEGAPGTVKAATSDMAWRQPRYRVAEHVSLPLAEEVKVTLKVSQNLHASMTPFIVGAVVGKAKTKIDGMGFFLENQLLTKAGLDLTGASQSDGAGGSSAAFYSPDFMVHYLAFMAGRPEFAVFERALPILGRDGTLAGIQKAAPGAGHVRAKTGTFGAVDLLNRREMLIGKGLAGYTTTPSGERYAIALYVNHLELSDQRSVNELAGEALGEIASAAYSLPID